MGLHDGPFMPGSANPLSIENDKFAVTEKKVNFELNNESGESTLNIISELDSSERCDLSAARWNVECPQSQSCCVCQAVWGHWYSQIDRQASTIESSERQLSTDVGTTRSIKIRSDFICRICLEEGGQEGFISPCNCSGTMGMVHKRCLERWLSMLNTSECEICRKKFEVQRNFRPIQRVELQRLPLEICGDLVCITVLSPLCILIVYFVVEASSDSIKKGRLPEAIVLISIATTAVVIFLTWVCCTIRNAVAFWLGNNRIVQLTVNQVGPERESDSRPGN